MSNDIPRFDLSGEAPEEGYTKSQLRNAKVFTLDKVKDPLCELAAELPTMREAVEQGKELIPLSREIIRAFQHADDRNEEHTSRIEASNKALIDSNRELIAAINELAQRR